MDIEEKYLSEFSDRLEIELHKLCQSFGLAGARLLDNDDITMKVPEDLAKDYFSDAVKEFAKYPEVSLAWAGYLGMAVACRWDGNWQAHKNDRYQDYYGARGYDDMDEHITRDILGYALDSEKAQAIGGTLGKCATLALSLIRREGFESQSIEAYYVLIRCVKVMFQIGASMELFGLGYKLERIKPVS